MQAFFRNSLNDKRSPSMDRRAIRSTSKIDVLDPYIFPINQRRTSISKCQDILLTGNDKL
jgi:hypothetical protein